VLERVVAPAQQCLPVIMRNEIGRTFFHSDWSLICAQMLINNVK
jgi:hypothetical protein